MRSSHDRKEEAAEMELDKFIIRRTALGQDRWNRRYWWGLAGVRGAVVAEELAQPSGPSTVSVIKDHVRACHLP